MPESLVEYKIWWQNENGPVILLSNHNEEGHGELDKKYSSEFKQLLLSKK